MDGLQEPSCIFCGTIGSHRIFWNDVLLVLQVDERYVELSRKEYLIIKPLLTGLPVTDRTLIWGVYGSTHIPLYEEPLSRHIERLRKKLHCCGLALPRITKYGYLLHSTEEEIVAS